MTILNVVLDSRSESALIGVDTLGALADGSRYPCAKLIPFVHVPAVVAIRGNTILLSIVTGTMQMTLWRDLDALLEIMPQLLAAGYAQLIGMQKAGHLPASLTLEDQTIVVVGWSARQEKVIAREWKQKTGAEGFIADEITPKGAHLCPWDQSIDRFCDVHVPADLEKLARAQFALLNERFPGSGTGGKLIVARLERDSLSVRHQCDLDALAARPYMGGVASVSLMGR